MERPRLVTIDAEYLHPGLAACYLRVQDGEAAFVETNTAHAVPRLLAALQAEGLAPEAVRWVIVTHVHLDHAGGAAALLAALPNATLVAHPRAARHLIDPSKLVASATAVYGAERFAQLYGSLDPIPAERVRTMEDGEQLFLGEAPLHFLHTRGHANHHFAVHDPARDTVYTGDTFGLVYPRLQRAGRFAFPSTSPTDFDAAEARASIDRILALGTATVCPTHFGEVDDPARTAAQLRWWIDRSEALVEEAVALAPAQAEVHVRAGVAAAMEEAAARAGLQLDEEDRELLAMDLDLNAQGLAWAAARRR
ncbi:MBL fold metallo-hydrolase [Vulgatibacter sp.]|uniref:MBL fold metallo-hydrolase n=1 Tax=Vulgatibacter sp. TaxID=1971226 RepID=UPI00356AA71B